MNLVKRLPPVFLLILLSSGLCRGAAPPEPKVEYSADSIMEAEQMTLNATVYHAAGKERREQKIGDLKQIVIIRRDKNLVWLLMPEQKMYMELIPSPEMKEKEFDLSSYKVERTPLGQETVEGVRTTKSKVVMTGPDGTRLDGFLWTTPEEITMKLEAVTQGKGERRQVKTALKNLKIGRQDPALFEIPAGYQKMSMGNPFGGMGNAPGGAPNLDEMLKGKRSK